MTPLAATGSSSATSACRRCRAAGSAQRRWRPAVSPPSSTCAPRAGLYIRVFPHKPITSIPLETRMGKGKGEPEYWAAVVRPGTVLYEISGISEEARADVFRPAGPQNAGEGAVPPPPAGVESASSDARTAMTKASEFREMSDEQLALTLEGDDRATCSICGCRRRRSGSTPPASSASSAG